MEFAFKRVADGKRGTLRGGQPISRCKLGTNVETLIAGHQRFVFEPEEESFFELATERLPDRGCRARLETGNPPRNGAICNVEQINADRSASATISILDSQEWSMSVPTVNQSRDKERNLHFLEEVYQMGRGFFPGVFLVDSYNSRRFPLFHLKIGRSLTQFPR